MTSARCARAAVPEGGVRLLGVSLAGLGAEPGPAAFQAMLFEPTTSEVAEPEAPIVEETTEPAPAPDRPWGPGDDARHDEHGHGWVQGAGHGRVTVRFETRSTGPIRWAVRPERPPGGFAARVVGNDHWMSAKGPEMAMTRSAEPRASFIKASLWMVGLSILLFWLPILGPVVAGLVGGWFAGTVGRAVLASLVPAVLLALLILGIGTLFDLPVVGALASGAIGLVILLGDVPLVLAAIVGALFSQRR